MGVQPTVVFDFDGVIHSYKSGWQGVINIPDEPVRGIKEEIERIRQAGYEVIVVSSRCSQAGGIHAIADYLDKHRIEVDGIHKDKPPTLVTIDDRAICFDGEAGGLLEKIVNFSPWTKLSD